MTENTETKPVIKYLKDYEPPEYFIHEVDLHFDLDAEKTTVTSKLYFSRREGVDELPMVLQGIDLKLLSLALNDERLDTNAYEVSDENLIIHKMPQSGVLVVKNEICPKTNESLEGLYESKGMLCTQCEPEGFRKITYFIDRPDNMCVFKVRLEADKKHYPQLLSNGNFQASGDLEHDRHFVEWFDPFPKPSYLFALVACDLAVKKDEFVTQSGRKVELAFYVEPSDLNKIDFAIEALKKSMRWDEQRYGCEYDLDLYMIVAVSHFNMGAMENKGLNIFNTKCVLASPDTATDQQYASVESIIAHEYFHNYSGNRVTCANWFQLSLKEGFTVFRDQQFSMELDSWLAHRIASVQTIRNVQFAQDAGPMAHPVRPTQYIEMNNFYTVTVYDKGAEVIRMLHTLLGDEPFIQGSKRYFQRYDGQAVTIEDFLSAVTENTGFNTVIFKGWYEQPGTPEVIMVYEYNQAEQTYKIGFEQSFPKFPDNKPVAIPIRLGLIDAINGEPVVLKTAHEKFKLDQTGLEGVFVFDQSKDMLEFKNINVDVVPSVFRDFSAPVNLISELPDQAYYHLMAHDTNAFNRFDSAQLLMNKRILELGLENSGSQKGSNQKESQNTQEALEQLTTAWLSVFNNQNISAEERALICTLPGYSSTAEFQSLHEGEILVENILAGYKRLQKHLATQCLNELLESYQQLQNQLSKKPYSPNAVDAGLRSLKNLCLSLLASVAHDFPDEKIEQSIYDHYQTADNITDRLAALKLLVHNNFSTQEAALKDFETRFYNNQLAMDHWFDIQASNPQPSTFETIHKLKQHPLYDTKSPNIVRSVIGSFVSKNHFCFHDQSGRGYELLADEIIYFNDHNPQLASRLMNPLTQWKRYATARTLQMRKSIAKIEKIENISPDVYEVLITLVSN